MAAQHCANTMAQRWVNVVFSANFYPKPNWQGYVGPICPDVMHPTQLGHVNISRCFILAQCCVNVVFSTIFIQNQSGRHDLLDLFPFLIVENRAARSGRHTLVQCWPNVMHQTQHSHVVTSHRCTLAQRWANVLIPTSYRSDCQWQNFNVGAMLGQHCTSNPNYRPTVLPYANVGPT